jgi:hypothetical protein
VATGRGSAGVVVGVGPNMKEQARFWEGRFWEESGVVLEAVSGDGELCFCKP